MDFIRAAISEGGGVLVHCAAGVSRSTALTLAYMMREHRMTLREALSAMRERRPIVWPNEGFVASLISLESSLIGINSLKVNCAGRSTPPLGCWCGVQSGKAQGWCVRAVKP